MTAAMQARDETGATAEPDVARPRRRGTWRSISSALLITVAAVLVPVSVIAGWARGELVDEATFVATFAPLATDPVVQTAIVDSTVTAIEAQLDLDSTTNALFDGIEGLGLPQSASAALDLLREPAAAGLRSLLRGGVERFVSSELFADVWSTALRVSHRAMLATVGSSSPDRAIVIDQSGQVAVQLGPIIRAITTHLADNGFPLAASMPEIDASIVIAQSDALQLIGTVHVITTTLGFWIPVATLGLLLAGILVARNRRFAVAGAGIGLGIGAGAFLIAALVGGTVIVIEAVRAGMPGPAVGAIYDRVVAGMRETAGDLVLIGVLAALLAIVLGSQRLRIAMTGINDRLAVRLGVRAVAQARWARGIVERRTLVRAALIILPVTLIVLLPLTTIGTVLIAVGALLIWWWFEILARGAEAPAAD